MFVASVWLLVSSHHPALPGVLALCGVSEDRARVACATHLIVKLLCCLYSYYTIALQVVSIGLC